MRLYFLRHGVSEDLSASGSDSDRRLTREGIDAMERIARALKRMDIKVDAILTSPLARAKETAEIVALELGHEGRVDIEERLSPGFGLRDLREIVGGRHAYERVMLVGHNFDFPSVAGQLAGGAAIDLKKGGLIRIEVDRIEPGGGVLEWLLTPKLIMDLAT